MQTFNPNDVARDAAKHLANLHLDHYEKRTAAQRLIEALTLGISRPWFVAALFIALLAWIGAHVARVNADQAWISVALEFLAVLMTALILTGQHKEQDLSDEREELTLHLLLLVDRKLSAATPAETIDVKYAKKSLDEAHAEEFARGK